MALHKLLLPFFLFLLSFSSLPCYSNLEEDPTDGYPDETSLYGITAYPTYYGLADEPEDFTVQSFDHAIGSQAAQKAVNVEDYGAKGDGSDDTKAFEKAWEEACSASTSAVLLVPKNKNYQLKPVTFSGPCDSDVSFMIEGTIEASSDRSDWEGKNPTHWILFDDIDNLFVGGRGTINGNGKIWWENSCKINKSLPCKDAPTAMTFYSCNNLRVQNLRFKDSPQIHVSFQRCTNVQASSLAITASEKSPNTDGIHVTRTKNIQITDCVIRTGDDCISIVSGSRGVKATNIVCGPGHGISIGSLGAHNSEARVSDVTVDRAQLTGTTNGARIKTWQGGRGYAKNIIFKNIDMNNVKNPIIIDQHYCDSEKPCNEQKSAVEVSNVLYKNIKGTSASEVAIKFDCSKSIPCHGIVLQDINLVREDGDAAKTFCENVKWTKKGKVVPTPCA